MTRLTFRSLLVITTIVALAFCAEALIAQGKGGGKTPPPPPPPPTNVRYRINWVAMPPQTTIVRPYAMVLTTNQDGSPTSALVVGYYGRTDRSASSAFVYQMLDPSAPTNPANRFWDIVELVGPTPSAAPWTSASTPISTFNSAFRGVNSAGQIAGTINDPAGARHAVYLNLNDVTPDLLPIPQAQVPVLGYEGNDVTEAGDILVKYWPSAQGGNVYEGYVFNPATPTDVTVISDPTTEIPIQFLSTTTSMQLNLFREVVGENANNVVIRHNMTTGQTLTIPNLVWAPDLNDSGQFPSAVDVQGSRNRVDRYATRIGANGSAEWTSTEKGTVGYRINNQGDMLYKNNNEMGDTFYYHDRIGQPINLKALVIAASDPNSWFRNATTLTAFMEVSDIDATDFGWVACSMSVPQPDGSTREAMALLIPEILP